MPQGGGCFPASSEHRHTTTQGGRVRPPSMQRRAGRQCPTGSFLLPEGQQCRAAHSDRCSRVWLVCQPTWCSRPESSSTNSVWAAITATATSARGKAKECSRVICRQHQVGIGRTPAPLARAAHHSLQGNYTGCSMSIGHIERGVGPTSLLSSPLRKL